MRLLVLLGLALLSGGTPLCADEPQPPTPTEKYLDLVKAHQQAQEGFSKAYQAAKTDEERQKVSKELGRQSSADYYAGRFLTLIRDHPKDVASLDAFRWLLARVPYAQETVQAADLVQSHWIEDERLADVCRSARHYTCTTTHSLLQAAIDKSPHRSVQGNARFALACSLISEADKRAAHEPRAREPLEQGAAKLLQQILDQYADVKDDSSTLGRAAAARLFELQHLVIGKVAPDIEGEDLDGKRMKLSDYRNQVVLVSFWGTWCGPCMAAIADELALVQRLEGKPFVIVGVNSDANREAAQKVCVEKGVSWHSFWDGGSTSGPVASKWNVQAWPTLYLVDGKGVIRYRGAYLRSTGYRDGKGGKPEPFSYLDEAVDKLLKELAEGKGP